MLDSSEPIVHTCLMLIIQKTDFSYEEPYRVYLDDEFLCGFLTEVEQGNYAYEMAKQFNCEVVTK